MELKAWSALADPALNLINLFNLILYTRETKAEVKETEQPSIEEFIH